MALRGWVTKRRWGQSGGWRRKARKTRHVKQGDLDDAKAGVHARRAEEPVVQESEHP